MRSPAATRHALEFNMTPMIDVTFLLIVFFITSSHLAQQEATVELNLPRASSGRDEPERPARRVTLNVLAEGRVLLGSDPVDVDTLQQKLQYEQRADRATSEPLEVRIRADRSVPYRVVEPLLLTCARSGVWNVSFAVVEAQP